MKKILIAYIPVLHAGYKKMLDKYGDVDEVFIFGTDVVKEFDYLRKEIRALSPRDMKAALEGLLGREIELLTGEVIEKLQDEDVAIIAPDEDVTRELVGKYFSDKEVTYVKIFLRWNRENSLKKTEVEPSNTLEVGEFEKEILGQVFTTAEQTSDWWLQVGAVIVKDSEVLLCGHNRYEQSPHQVWSEGDPRNCFWRGVNIDLTTSLHAERGVISEAARQGIALEGTTMYVTHFPCPTCAKAVASAGIKKLYYAEGYSVLDGQSALEKEGVEIIKVEGINAPERGDDFLPYPEKKKT